MEINYHHPHIVFLGQGYANEVKVVDMITKYQVYVGIGWGTWIIDELSQIAVHNSIAVEGNLRHIDIFNSMLIKNGMYIDVVNGLHVVKSFKDYNEMRHAKLIKELTNYGFTFNVEDGKIIVTDKE